MAASAELRCDDEVTDGGAPAGWRRSAGGAQVRIAHEASDGTAQQQVTHRLVGVLEVEPHLLIERGHAVGPSSRAFDINDLSPFRGGKRC